MHRIRNTLLALTVCAASGLAVAANEADLKAQYEQERARCLSGSTGQDQASCLRSAGAAYDSSRQGRMNDANSSYRENAMSRCRVLPAADRVDCESRIDGRGTTSGSVSGGGIVRETVTPTAPLAPVAPVAPVVPGASTAPGAPVAPGTMPAPITPVRPATPLAPTTPPVPPVPGAAGVR